MQTVERLYTYLQPENYDLVLKLDRQNRIFEGSITLTGIYRGNGKAINLHSKDLSITQAAVNGVAITASVDKLNDVITLAPHSAPANNEQIIIDVSFTGHITDSMHGLYPSIYSVNGVKQELLTTQFESHHAREVFPCVDEPEAKATFNLTLITEQGIDALSNMPIKQQTNDKDWLVTHFDTSPKMSSYLLAFVVGDLQSKSTTTKDGIKVTTWATKAQPADSLDFGLDVAKRSIEFFNDYFGVPYPLPKADHVAIPDFSSGAMENWGLITYREVCLLADSTTSISSREYIATVIAHETSHQWFGNLVTMKWWDDLWLNESFATLMEYVCVDALFPKWNIWMNFATQEVLSALRRDYLPGVQAIKTTVNHPDEISTLFDPSIVYAKGARTLAMCRQFIGDDAFRDGLKLYFETHKYSNTSGDDLWQSLSTSSNKDVGSFMTPWIEQSGMPRVSAKLQGSSLTIEQQPFIIPASSNTSTQTWPVPLTPSVDSLPVILDAESITAKVGGQTDPAIIYLNVGSTTHAIFQYDDSLLGAILPHIPNMAPVDRLALLHDFSLLARAGYKSALDLLKLLDSYTNETSEPVWDIIALTIADLRRLIEGNEEAEKALKQTVHKLVQPLFGQLGIDRRDNESEEETKLRSIIVGLMAYAEDRSLIDQLLVIYRSTAKFENLSAELRPIIFSAVTRHGATKDIERLLDVHQTTANADLKNDIAAGLTSTRDAELAKQLIAKLTDDSFIRKQDLFRWFAWFMRNYHTREATWQWMTEQWPWIEKNFAGDKSYDDFARYSAAAMSTDKWLDEYQRFFNDKQSIPALSRSISLGVADIKTRADWYNRDSEILAKKLISGQ